MRKILLLVATFLFPLVAFSQNSSLLKDAQDLFAAGDYSAAVTKFQEAVNKLSGRERNIAQIQLGTAQTCVTALSKAKAAESSKDFDTAINEYQKIIDANPNDTKVKGLQEAARKSKREANPTLTVSKSSLSFSSSGGTQTITVNSSMDWTLVDQTSSICSVSRSGNVITVTCTSNSTTSARNTSFLVKTVNGAKEQRVSISQTGRVSTSSTTSSTSSSRSSTASRLEVKPTSISLSSGSGTALVDVTTDANDYNVSLLPSWAKLKSKYGTFFSLSYTENTSTTPRSDWFNVTAGGKTVKVTITQSGRGSSRSTTYSSSSHTSSTYGTSRSSNNYRYKKFPDKQWGVSTFVDAGFSDDDDLLYILSYGVGAELRFKEYTSRNNFVVGADIMRVAYNYYDYGSDYVTHLIIPAYYNHSIWNDPTGNMYLSAGAQIGIGLEGKNVSTLPFAVVGRWGVCSRHFDLNLYMIGYVVSPVTNGAGSPIIGARMTYYF